MQSQILPSRAALVDRIELQFEYGQHLICLVGSSGLGKSYLAESFITDKYPEFCKAFIKLSAHTSDVELTTQLLQHSFRAPLIDQTLSLSDNFLNLHRERPSGPCLWVLDGARHLSDEMIMELQKLVKLSLEKIYILVTAQSPNMLPQAIDLHLEPLSASESKALMKMFFKQLPLDEDPIFQTFLTAARGNPAVLLDWRAQDQQLAEPRKSYFTKLQWHFTLLTVLVAMLMVAFVYKKEMRNLLPSETLNNNSVDTVIESRDILSTQDGSIGVEAEVLLSEADDIPQPLGKPSQSNEVIDTGNQLPFEQPNEQHVDAVLSALIEPELNKPELSVVSHDEEHLGSGLLVENEENSSLTGDLSLVQVTSNNEQVDLHNHEQLLALADTAWSIQLLAVKDKQIAKTFMAHNQQYIKNLNLYGTMRGGDIWWIVVQSGFTTLDDAKDGKAKLPDEVLTGQPFFKRQAKIKQEIALYIR